MQQHIDSFGVIHPCHTDDVAHRSLRIGAPLRWRMESLRIDTARNMYDLLGAESVRGEVGVAACAENLVVRVRFAQKCQHGLAQWQSGKVADITRASRPA